MSLTEKDLTNRTAGMAMNIGELPAGDYLLTVEASADDQKASRPVRHASGRRGLKTPAYNATTHTTLLQRDDTHDATTRLDDTHDATTRLDDTHDATTRLDAPVDVGRGL